MKIVVERENEKMTIAALDLQETGKKFFVDGVKRSKATTELIIRSFAQMAIEDGSIIEIDARLANEFKAITDSPFKGEFAVVYTDADGKPVEVDDVQQDMFADSVDTTPYHIEIKMCGNKTPIFEILRDGQHLINGRNGYTFSKSKVDEWIMQAYEERRQYPNMTIEVSREVATLHLDSFACNPRIIRELNVILTDMTDDERRQIAEYEKIYSSAMETVIDDYVVTADAQQVAIDAEIEIANEIAKSEYDSQITVASAKAKGLSYEEFIAASNGMSSAEYNAYQTIKTAEIADFERRNKIPEIKLAIASLQHENAYDARNLNDIVINQYRPNQDFEEYMDEIANRIADRVNQITELKKQLVALEPAIDVPETDGSEEDDDNQDFIAVIPSDDDDTYDELIDAEIVLASRNSESELTVEQIQKLIDATIAERTEAIDALEEAEANEEISQTHIDYLRGYIDELLDEYNDLCKQLDAAKAKVAEQHIILHESEPTAEENISDSLARAMELALLKCQEFCRDLNISAAQNELKLFAICREALSKVTALNKTEARLKPG